MNCLISNFLYDILECLLTYNKIYAYRDTKFSLMSLKIINDILILMTFNYSQQV